MNGPPNLNRTLGERLAKARRLNGWSQQDVADQLGISRRSVVRYEDDVRVPSLPIIVKWANVCQVPYLWIIDEHAAVSSTERVGGIARHPSLRGPPIRPPRRSTEPLDRLTA